MSRTYRWLRIPLVAAVLATSAWASQAHAVAAPPPQEPGVTLRVYDLQVALSELCILKSGQTPNIDKLMPTINWTTTTDFGFSDHFLTHVLGNVNISTAGNYTFRLISDDGSRLTIDNTIVVNHDGLHGATPKDGTINLTTGYHSLKIEQFENQGDQQVTLQWMTPGSSSFVLVPNSALSTDAGVVRVTAPGKKECEGGADSPGDGLPLTSVHPSFTLNNLRPTGFEPQVTGLDWLPDGRLAVATWGGSLNVSGEVYLLSNVTGNTSPGQVTTQRIATGLKEPMGIKYVDGKLYVSEKQRLTELNDTNGDGVTDVYRTVATWPFGNNFHEFGFGLLYQDGFFYLNLSVSINYGGATTDPQPAPNRGTTIKVDKNTGAVSYIAGGLRTPHGIGWGPENGIFVTDNQGGWLPSSKLLHVKQNRFFNHYMNPAGPFDSNPPTQPVLWLPQNEIGNSPSTPVWLTQGTYANQMLIGDVTYGGLQRAYLEKVNGEYQGALFRLTQGFEAGVTEVSLGPDGGIYVGGLHGGGNWGQEGKLSFGLQKIMPNSTSTFDMLAMRAIPGGFEIEYTQPLSTETATNLASRYRAKQWRYVPTASYGGPKIDEQTLAVSSATLSADGKKVTLLMNGLKTGHVVYIRSPRPFSSNTGQSLWSTEVWYTLNSLAGSQPPTGNLALNKPATADSSCNANEGPAKAVNGSVSGGNTDKWCSTGATKWMQVDIGATTGVNRFVVKHASTGGESATWNTRDFTIQVSTNGTSWTTVANVTGNTAGTTTHDIATAQARYARLNVTAPTSTTDGAARIYEFEVYGATAPPATNVALNKAATADSSCNANEGPSKAVNGSVSGGNTDKWCSSGATKWMQVDLGSNHDVSRFIVKHASTGGENAAWNTRDFTIQVSTNGTSWTTVTNVAGNTAGTTTHDIATTQARYVRLNVANPGDTNAARIYEFEVYGSGGTTPPRITLFDGSNLNSWEHTNGSPATWPIANGSMEDIGGDIRTKQSFGDFKLHVEFWLPNLPPDVTGQQRANSGVYLQDRYELQVLDSWGDTTLASDECGAIYSKKAPDVNAATAPLTWQTYEITFRAARFNGSGQKIENARVTVVWNGVVVHNNAVIDGSTGGGIPEGPSSGPIRLQDHGDPGENVRYRTIWIEPM